jgi:hypothetical protein
MFLVYEPSLDKVYRIPVNAVGLYAATFRLQPTKNKQAKHVRMAKEFEF